MAGNSRFVLTLTALVAGTHPGGPGTPPLADPVSWSNVPVQFPKCTWEAPSGKGPNGNGANPTVTCPGLPTFINSYPPRASQSGGAYLTPAGQGSCAGVPAGPYGNLTGNSFGCTEAVEDDGAGNRPDGSIDGQLAPPPCLSPSFPSPFLSRLFLVV